jgi:hypothetical protein
MSEAAGQMTSQPRLPPAPSSWTDARVRDQRLHSKYKKRTGPYEHVTCYVYRDDGDKTKEGWVCNYCYQPANCLIVLRMLSHLSGVSGNGITGCTKVTYYKNEQYG